MKDTRIIIPVLITTLCLLYSCSGSKFRHLNKVSAGAIYQPYINANIYKNYSSKDFTSQIATDSVFIYKRLIHSHQLSMLQGRKVRPQNIKRIDTNKISVPIIFDSDSLSKKSLKGDDKVSESRNYKNSAVTISIISFLFGILAIVSGSNLYSGIFLSLSLIFGVIAFVKYTKNKEWLLLIIPIAIISYTLLAIFLHFSI
jgi:hypothetical protein